jgi:hypothetical protein
MRTCLTAFVFVVISAGVAQAMDGPFTWEEVLCTTDAVAEIEMVMATKATPDRMIVRNVIWNRTRHRIHASYGHPNIPYVTETRFDLRASLADYRHDHPNANPPDEFVAMYRRALEKGSYRTIAFLEFDRRHMDWGGGGWVYDGVEWLDHPKHAEWWAKIQPYLRRVIEAAKRHEKPAFCKLVNPRATTRETPSFVTPLDP